MQPGDAADELRSLIERAQCGDAGAIAALVERHLPSIRAFVRLNVDRSLRARESCSDIVQNVCVDVLQHLGKFEYRGEGSFRSWLCVTALNRVRMEERFHRAEKRDAGREVAPPQGDVDEQRLSDCYQTLLTPSRVAMDRERLAQVEAAFDRLPADYRQVIGLARIAGLSQAEIAEQLDKTVPAVKALLNRAMVRLTAVLDEIEQGGGGRG